MSRPGLKSIAVNTAYLSTAKLVASVARIIYAIALARLLGAELYGLFNYGLSWYVFFVPLSGLGLNILIIHEVGRKTSGPSPLLNQSLAIRVMSSVLVAVFSLSLGLAVNSDPVVTSLMVIFAFALVGRGMSLWANAVFTAYERSGYVFAQETSFRLLEVVVGMTLLLNGYGVVEIALVHAAVWLVQGMLSMSLIRRNLPPISPSWAVLARPWPLLRRGLPFVLSAFLMGWILQGPILLYRHADGFGPGLGQLALALQALFIIGAVVSELSMAALPALSRSVDRGDNKSVAYFDFVMRAGLMISTLAAIAAVAIGHELLQLLFGNGYTVTVELLPWVLLLIAPYFWLRSLSSMLVAKERYWWVTAVNVVGAVAFTAAFFVAVPFFDLAGAVTALGVGLLCATVTLLALLRPLYPLGKMALLLRLCIASAGSLALTVIVAACNPWLALFTGSLSLLLLSHLLGVVRPAEVRSAIAAVSELVRKGRDD